MSVFPNTGMEESFGQGFVSATRSLWTPEDLRRHNQGSRMMNQWRENNAVVKAIMQNHVSVIIMEAQEKCTLLISWEFIYSWPLNNVEVRGIALCTVKNCDFWFPPKVNYSHPSVSGGNQFQDTPQETKSECSSPLYKVAWINAHSRPFASMDSQLRIENSVVDDVLLVESMDVKPGDMEDKLCIYWKNLGNKCIRTVQTHVVQGSTMHILSIQMSYLIQRIVAASSDVIKCGNGSLHLKYLLDFIYIFIYIYIV